MNRRKFVKYLSTVAVVLANGDVLRAADINLHELEKKKVKLRFAVASDGHYGQKDTDYEQYFQTMVSRVNAVHKTDSFAFCMINGDIVHDDKIHYAAAKKALDQLEPAYYVSQGNHDQVTATEWQQIWNMPVNHDFSIGKNSFIIGTTSNEKGEYLCPDVAWIASKLEQYRKQQHVFVFLHINPVKLTKFGVDCPELVEVFAKYKNVKAVFNGHDHDEEGIKTREGIPYIFDAHFGGNWGTAYRGFRVVELLKDNSLVTYILNPLQKINEAAIL